ncbi:hypothetical protein ACOMHN_051105 [Nucella lapillus]
MTGVYYAKACFDSTGNFYCTTLWYFWFSMFWLCMFLFVAGVCIVNYCTKKNRQVDVQIRLPPVPRTTQTGAAKSSLSQTAVSAPGMRVSGV